MSSDELEDLVKRASTLAGKVPERFQEKCFEIVLSSLLGSLSSVHPESKEPQDQTKPKEDKETQFRIPVAIRALFQQYSIPEEKLSNLFVIEGEKVEPKYQLKTTKKAEAQIQLALLLALETALRADKFEFGIENVRAKCQEYKCYDQDNFSNNFKRNSAFFKSLSDSEHIELSIDGKAELAQVIAVLVK